MSEKKNQKGNNLAKNAEDENCALGEKKAHRLLDGRAFGEGMADDKG